MTTTEIWLVSVGGLALVALGAAGLRVLIDRRRVAGWRLLFEARLRQRRFEARARRYADRYRGVG